MSFVLNLPLPFLDLHFDPTTHVIPRQPPSEGDGMYSRISSEELYPQSLYRQKKQIFDRIAQMGGVHPKNRFEEPKATRNTGHDALPGLFNVIRWLLSGRANGRTLYFFSTDRVVKSLQELAAAAQCMNGGVLGGDTLLRVTQWKNVRIVVFRPILPRTDVDGELINSRADAVDDMIDTDVPGDLQRLFMEMQIIDRLTINKGLDDRAAGIGSGGGEGCRARRAGGG